MKIIVNGIKKSYGKKQVLNGISFSAESGECIGILGCNGCGKSTLLNILAGIINKNDGSFFCDGSDLLKNAKKREKILSYVPQTPPLINELTAKDNLAMWYSTRAMNASLSSGVLRLLGIDKFLNVPVRKMSGGMKKRLSIGCAVSNNPSILFLDEPSSALDPIARKIICDYIEKFKAFGGITLIATHDLSELSLCTRCFIIKDGDLIPFDANKNINELVHYL